MGCSCPVDRHWTGCFARTDPLQGSRTVTPSPDTPQPPEAVSPTGPDGELIGAISTAAQMLSEHIERYWDGDWDVGQEPAERGSLRVIQHHLDGSLIGPDGEYIVAPSTSSGSDGEVGT